MLTQLHIQNIAVIQKATIGFGAGLNVFTGETGAGKTILLSAIDAVLGERTSRELIRAGEERAFVSALFEGIAPRARKILEEQGYPAEDGAVLITREMTESGRNTCKVNGMPATAAILREIASPLIHIHGQRDSLQILAPERHMELIDRFGEYGELLLAYGAAYERLRAVEGELAALRMDDAQKEQRMDLLRYQIDEIEAARLTDGSEEAELLSRRGVIRNAEKILASLLQAYSALRGEGESRGIDERMDVLVGGVFSAAQYMEELAPVAQRLEEIGYELAEYAAEIRERLDGFEFDPRELEEIEERLDLLRRLQRKYGTDIPGVLEYCARAREELEGISTAERRIQRLEEELLQWRGEVISLGTRLSEERMAAAEQFILQVEGELAFLDMPAVKLSVRRAEKPPAGDGMDELELMIVTNVGEAPKLLSKIVSGGEISRIMLAVKNVLADRDDIGTLVFDEVDTGVSGRAAQKIGRKLHEAARSRQVICVTHLAQVAAFADRHLFIRKEVEGGRTFTRIAELGEEERVRELARIMSGEALTEASLQNARELIARGREGAVPSVYS